MLDSYTFSNAIRLKVYLITGKWLNFASVHFVSSEYDSEKDNTTYFIQKLTNLALILKNLVVSGSSFHEFEMCLNAFFTEEFTASFKNMER